MSEVIKPILLDETGQAIVSKLVDIKNAIQGQSPAGEPVMITVVTPPTKTEYSILDTFDPTGIVVSAVFTNGLYYDITNECSYSPSTPLTLDDDEITVSWTWHETGHTFITKQAIEVGAAPWSTGTDAQIVASLQAHYAGLLDITDYWTVGDKRTVSLSAMAATGVSETHDAQDVVFVLSNVGGKYLEDGTTECAFQVDQEDSLDETGSLSSVATTSPVENNYKECDRRTWCNSVYYNALPSGIKGIFKKFINQSGNGGDAPNTIENTVDYFALRSTVEITGVDTYATPGQGTQAKYYETSTNRIKKVDGTAAVYMTRSAIKDTKYGFNTLNDQGTFGSGSSTGRSDLGISPFGVV